MGITRAEQRLYLTRALARNWYGRPSFHRQSRFLGEIPPELIEWRRDEVAATRAATPAQERMASRPGARSPGNRAGPRAVAGGHGHPRQVRPRHGGLHRRVRRPGRGQDRLRRGLRRQAPGASLRPAGEVVGARSGRPALARVGAGRPRLPGALACRPWSLPSRRGGRCWPWPWPRLTAAWPPRAVGVRVATLAVVVTTGCVR